MAKDLINIVTPIGELHWVNIKGQGKLKYNKKDEYEYTATLYLKGKEAEELKAKIDAVVAKPPAGSELKSTGYKELFEDKEGNLYFPNKNDKVIVKEDGEKKDITKDCKKSGVWAFVFRTGTTFPDGKNKVVNVYNCAKPPQKVELGERRIGNGTKGAISGRMKMYEGDSEHGVSLFLHAIQITSYKDFEGGTGFEEQEGDFYGFDDNDGFEAPSENDEAQDKPKSKPRL